jgi:hypothetical protein
MTYWELYDTAYDDAIENGADENQANAMATEHAMDVMSDGGDFG